VPETGQSAASMARDDRNAADRDTSFRCASAPLKQLAREPSRAEAGSRQNQRTKTLEWKLKIRLRATGDGKNES
jgi:hypothetical protein